MVISSGQGLNSAEDYGQVIELALSTLSSNPQKSLSLSGPPSSVDTKNIACPLYLWWCGEERPEGKEPHT